MDHPLRRPEEILAYRSLRQILSAKPRSLWTVDSKDTALTAMRLMAEKKHRARRGYGGWDDRRRPFRT